jgi:hypothetical protein
MSRTLANTSLVSDLNSQSYRKRNTELIDWVRRGQFNMGWETFGLRWTSLMNQARIPLRLEQRFGAGADAVSHLGMCSMSARPKMSPDRIEEAPPFLQQFARNIIAWVGQSN